VPRARGLTPDALLLRVHAAGEISGPMRLQPHRPTPFARVPAESLPYPP